MSSFSLLGGSIVGACVLATMIAGIVVFPEFEASIFIIQPAHLTGHSFDISNCH